MVITFKKDDGLISHVELRMVDLVHELVICGILTNHQMIDYMYDKIDEILLKMKKL